jgi:hypothetical protein
MIAGLALIAGLQLAAIDREALPPLLRMATGKQWYRTSPSFNLQ